MEVLNKKIKISSPIGLQIGNIVYDNNCDFHRIRANDFSRFNHPNMGGDYGLYAIELSPEILEKCGIKDVWIKNSWKVVEDVSDGESFGWAMKVRNANHDKEIEFAYFKYLHQLQNLYWCLCGEELIVNL